MLGDKCGQPFGGRTTTHSLSGRTPWQKAFLTLPWRVIRLS